MTEPPTEQPGAIPIWALHGRPSASADAARLAELHRLRQMTPRERAELALLLGLQTWRLQTRRLGEAAERR